MKVEHIRDYLGPLAVVDPTKFGYTQEAYDNNLMLQVYLHFQSQ